MNSTQPYSAIVVGAGHAGVEASLAVARAGFPVLVVTMDVNAIARMSCNPAIGGLAKGHIVREIDALGGEMGLATDATGIQFRMLNRSKGPAVWAPRAQADKKQYELYMKRVLESEKNLTLKQGQVVGLIVENGKCRGVRTKEGEEFYGEHVVLTTGTFLHGLIHVGEEHYPGGRRDEPPAVGLSGSLRENGIELVRFKTGTPPRLRKQSIRWEHLEEQKGDEPPPPFSYRTKKIVIEQWPCYLTHTNEKVHEIIRNNLHRSPLYAGRIVGIGPRYCPSVEDKVVKFPDKKSHQIYLEPEGRDTDEIYMNGFPTSLPKDVQDAALHQIPGLESAEILKFGYAIEYDAAPPTQLKHTLETKKIRNLFFAGQINCTSGYEEAAAQGLMAGLNLVRKLRGEAEFVLDRTEAYIAVMIDDLVTCGTNEPYRMFTSRAEFRLLLRQDNADERLMEYGYQFGIITKEVYGVYQRSIKNIADDVEKLKAKRFLGDTLYQYLKRPDVTYKALIENGLHSSNLNDEEIHKLETEIKYEGYIARQKSEVAQFKKLEKRKIPEDTNYESLASVSREAREKLKKIKPESIGQAARIPGISSCDLSLLAVHIEKEARRKNPSKI
ncbi:MAG TPA: tRNA uridine-5-carboxymethylaminomethyl(34) synthesis enzyme MnmG [Candidatus Omnitrophota bacterium]|nr:tRNA uridine-5-carboxymethylaminomethyl(34) synthesis enzyme MnmG [Candidatus Omnitrophota bacterium]HPS36581.1 tRNA uridine-5-carboxymethylaminomethyl(34) synthesis enzyme MnmG [Candidatus Omnitrophota bacterium]